MSLFDRGTCSSIGIFPWPVTPNVRAIAAAPTIKVLAWVISTLLSQVSFLMPRYDSPSLSETRVSGHGSPFFAAHDESAQVQAKGASRSRLAPLKCGSAETRGA